MNRRKVFFVRHGESEWNKANLFCGWHDVNLSEKGEYEAHTISAAALKRVGAHFDVAYISCLKRTEETLNIILKELECGSIPVHMSWRLNERHYGELTGFNKRQMADVYGEEQVQVWRRSFNVPPPPISNMNPYYECIRTNPKFRKVPEDLFPVTETLESTMERVIPYWMAEIVPEIRKGKNVLVVAHGTSLRGLVKHIEAVTDEQIMKINIPNSIPFCFEFDDSMKPVGGIQYLADEATVRMAVEKVASIGSK